MPFRFSAERQIQKKSPDYNQGSFFVCDAQTAKAQHYV